MRNLPVNFFDNAIEDIFKGSFKPQEILRLDLHEEDDKFVVQADAPGYTKDSIKITFDKGYLNIDLEDRRVKEKVDGQRVIFSERSVSKKSRRLDIGDKINVEEISANFENGILTITLPKKESATLVKTIEIK